MQLPALSTISKFTLLVAATIFSGLLFLQTRQPESGDNGAQLSMAYYLNSAELSGTNAEGELLYRVWADQASQVPFDDSVEMQKVRMLYAPEGPQAWNLSAKSGRIPADASVIELNGNVVIKSGVGNPAITTIKTQHLNIDPATRQAETTAAVVVDYQGQNVNAIGLQADLKKNRLKLLADVNGDFIP